MTTQNYLVVENNVVTNLVVWDGGNDWTPPSNAIMLAQETTPAMLWNLSSDKSNFVLTEVVGAGAIGFTWNGTVLTTPDSQPASIIQTKSTENTTLTN